MRGYAELNVFTPQECDLWLRATALVIRVDEVVFPDLRCHELARAVGQVLDLPVQDGSYGFVEHSWLWTRPVDNQQLTSLRRRLGFPNVLDVYSVGALPVVRLVDGGCTALPHIGWAYRPGDPRTDVDQAVVDALVRLFSEVP